MKESMLLQNRNTLLSELFSITVIHIDYLSLYIFPTKWTFVEGVTMSLKTLITNCKVFAFFKYNISAFVVANYAI